MKMFELSTPLNSFKKSKLRKLVKVDNRGVNILHNI